MLSVTARAPDASINGVPSCASDFLLNKMIREAWGQPNAFVTTDCGAVSNMLGQLEPSPGHTRLAAVPEEAAAWTIMNGTDLEMGLVAGGGQPSGFAHSWRLPSCCRMVVEQRD